MSTTKSITKLEAYFQKFRQEIVGHDQEFQTPYGKKKLIYADWTASGRLYRPIEKSLLQTFGPFVGNTHTETNVTGTSMTMAYHYAQNIIKNHVNASNEDVLIMTGSGMTGAVNKFQRILGFKNTTPITVETDRPIVFVTHIEHHSNDVSWRETIADVEMIDLSEEGNVDLEHLKKLLHKYRHRKIKIAAVCGCSNVTGIQTPYHEIAEMMHSEGGLCFVDFACSAPYINIDMHPKDQSLAQLDAIYFSMHKFLGGPGTPGVLVFNQNLYNNAVPDHPGGGTVTWVDAWGKQSYHDPSDAHGIEAREDGGTPPFLQTIKAAHCVKLKEAMGAENMLAREEELLHLIFDRFTKIKNLHILAPDQQERLGVISFYIDNLHYNLGVKMLNDKFGIQVRGGCACAGPYGHCLLKISREQSQSIKNQIFKGQLHAKPGWIRMSIHPIMTNAEVDYILNAIEQLANEFEDWSKDYSYQVHNNEFLNVLMDEKVIHYKKIQSWFES